MDTNGFIITVDELGNFILISRSSGRQLSVSTHAMWILLDWVTSDLNERTTIEKRYKTFFDALQRVEILSETSTLFNTLNEWESRWGILSSTYVNVCKQQLYQPQSDVLTFFKNADNDNPRNLPQSPTELYTSENNLHKIDKSVPIHCDNYANTNDKSAYSDIDTPIKDIDYLLNIRRTYRELLDKTISKQDFIRIITSIFSIKLELQPEIGSSLPLKAFPSGGARHELWPLIYVNNVTDVDSGFYYYNDNENILVQLSSALTIQEKKKLLFNQPFAKNAAFTIIAVADMNHYSWKYRSVDAQNIIWANAGSAMATISLLVTSMNLGSVITPAISHEILSKYINLRHYEMTTLAISIGAPDTIKHDEFIETLRV